MLDEDKVTVEEKVHFHSNAFYVCVKYVGLILKFQVSSVNKYDPPMELVAARDHMTHLVYQMMQPQVLYDRLEQIKG